MHFVIRWFHCRTQSWKPFSGIPCTNTYMLRWMSGMSANLCLVRVFFNFGKSQKISKGAKSDEYFRWSISVMDFLARNLWALNASWAGTLSCWRFLLSGQSSRLVLCPQLHLPFAICLSTLWVTLHVFSSLSWIVYAIKKHSISSKRIQHKPVWQHFPNTFTNHHNKFVVYPLLQTVASKKGHVHGSRGHW
jgi:hypothetical protein